MSALAFTKTRKSVELGEEDMVDIFQADTAGIFSIHNQTKVRRKDMFDSGILLFSGPGCSLGWWGRTLLLLLGLLHLLLVRPPLLGANIAQLLLNNYFSIFSSSCLMQISSSQIHFKRCHLIKSKITKHKIQTLTSLAIFSVAALDAARPFLTTGASWVLVQRQEWSSGVPFHHLRIIT